MSYGQYVTLLGAPNPPTRGMVAFAHSFDEYAIHSVDADGSGLRQRLEQSGSVSEPVESPDGKLIAFMSTRDGSGQIYVVDADGGNERKLTSGPGFNIGPAWSPDGRHIAFSSARHGNERRLTQLTRNRVDDSWPTWSPDGQRLAFVSDRGGVDDVWVTSLAEGGAVNYTNEEDDDASAIAPDATRSTS